MANTNLNKIIIVLLLLVVLDLGLQYSGLIESRPWLNFLAIVGFCYLSIWIHEFGHTLAGMAVGFHIKRITIGMGRELTRKQIGNTLIVVTLVLAGE